MATPQPFSIAIPPIEGGGTTYVQDTIELARVRNASATAQNIATTDRTYLAGSNLVVPITRKLVSGAVARWTFSMTKTAAGSATSAIDVAVGITATVTDTAELSFTKPAGTAAADEAFCTVIAVVRTAGAAGVLVGHFVMVHNLASTGHAQIPCVVVNDVETAVDLSADNVTLGLCLTAGANDDITIELLEGELAIARAPTI